MKILLTHRYFWPDTAPYALMLRSIGAAMAEAGHEVHVLSSMPSYRADANADLTPRQERLDDLNVNRIWVFGDEKRNPIRRLANLVLYSWALFVTILRQRPDLVSASTFPPVIAAWSASLAARLTGARFVYHMQDIHPEVSQLSGGALGRGLPMRLLRWLDNQTLRRSAAIVVLSEDMANSLHARGLGPLPIHIINNLSLDAAGGDAIQPPAELRKPEGKRRVIFAGNLGRFQQLPLLADGVSRLFDTHPDLELFFLGDGTALRELEARWGGHAQVSFAGFLPFDQAKVLIEEADIGLVSLLPGIYRVAYPSKVLSYAGLGLPMLALVEPESELARSLLQGRAGAVPDAHTPEAIAAALKDLLERHITRDTVLAWHETIAARTQILSRWRALLQGLERR
jgi:glycosyltransferase involved in cell wall biosynthesis